MPPPPTPPPPLPRYAPRRPRTAPTPTPAPLPEAAAPALPLPYAARAIVWMLLGSALFAAMATFVGFAHQRDPGLSTFTSSAFRSIVNLLALLALSWRAPLSLFGDARPALWARGLFGGVALLTYFAAIRYLSVGEAAFLNQTSAVWVALLAPWLLGQRSSGAAWLAILGSLAGVGLLAHPRPGPDDSLGRILGLVSGVAAAGAYVSVSKAAATNPPTTIVFWFTLVSSIASVALVLLTGGGLPADLVTAAHLVGAGLSAAAAQLLMTAAYRDGHVASVAAAGAASPLLTTLLGWALLGQVPDTRARIGMAVLVVCSAVLPFWGGRRK